MKYLMFDKDQIVSDIIYCNKNGNETPEDIANAIITDFFIGEFIAKDHTALSKPCKSDKDMFILRDINGRDYIWQVCGKVSDCVDTIIPHLYRIRKVGIMVIDYNNNYIYSKIYQVNNNNDSLYELDLPDAPKLEMIGETFDEIKNVTNKY